MLFKKQVILFFTIISFTSDLAFSQDNIELTKKDSTVVSSWILGFGYNIVDDSATPFGGNIFNIKESWNAVPYPSSISLGKSFKSGLMIKTVASYNKYKIGKLIDGTINLQERDYYAIDAMLSYDLNTIFGETGWFDPFVQVGGGYSAIGSLGRTTGNVGLGFNTWLNDRWELNFNSMGKWGIKKGETRQLQHSAGVVYRFGVEKELTVKGKEKLVRLEEFEKEKIRVNEAIVKAKEEAIKAKLLADHIAREKENARLAQLEKERLDQIESIQRTLDSLGNVYFDLNSSYLTSTSKAILHKLVTLLKDNATVELEVASYTDSRGTDKYNLWLSERRVKNTILFLVQNGIIKSRLQAKAYGEHNLLNDCDNTRYCPESKHKVNRRSEFIIIRKD